MAEPDFAAVHAFTIQLAKDAGKMILEGSSKRTSSAAGQGSDAVENKKNRVDRECCLSRRFNRSSRR